MSDNDRSVLETNLVQQILVKNNLSRTMFTK